MLMRNQSGLQFPGRKKWKKDGLYLLLLSLPFIIAVFLFNYLPLFGWVYAFFDYKPGIPISQTAFIGLAKFIELFKEIGDVIRVLRNTLILSLMSIICSPLPVILAVLITEAKGKKFRKIVQTVTTLPNFISWIIVFSLAFTMFSSEGVLNQILLTLGIIKDPLNILGNTNIVWTFQIGLQIWKTIGWNAIIYLAAIAGIDCELYDAARVDGAGRFRSIIHVTLPGISSTFFVLLLLSISSLLNAGSGIEQYLVFKNDLIIDKIEVIDLYVYKLGLIINDYPFATVVGIFKTIVSIILLFVVNSFSKKIRGESIV